MRRRDEREELALEVVALLAALAIGVTRPWALIALGSALPAAKPVRSVLGGARGRDLLPVLRDTGRLELAYALLLGLGLAI